MAFQNQTSEAWKTYVTLFFSPDSTFTLKDQLLHHSQPWQNKTPSHLKFYRNPHPESTYAADSNSGMNFAIKTSGDQKKIIEKNLEDIKEKNIEHIISLIISHRLLPLPSNFQSLSNKNHLYKLCLSYGFRCNL